MFCTQAMSISRFTSVITTSTIPQRTFSEYYLLQITEYFFLPKTYQRGPTFLSSVSLFFHRDVTRVGWYQLLDPSAKLHSNAIKYNQQQSGTRLPHSSLARWVPTRQPQSVKCDRWNRPPREESGLWSVWWVCPLIAPSPLWPAEIISNH